MATELAHKTFKTRSLLGQKVKESFVKATALECEPLIFNDLKEGDNFIQMPIPGDNMGHGGLLGKSWIFKKINPIGDACEPLSIPYYNAIRQFDGYLMHILDDELVYIVY